MNFISFLFSLRYVSLIAVISSFIGAIIMFIFGALKIAGAVILMLTDQSPTAVMTTGNMDASHVMLLVINSVDSFLFALVLLIFAFGIYELFVNKIKVENGVKYPPWIKIESIEHLKGYLAQVIIIILFVQFLELVLLNGERGLPWEAIVLPVSILCLSGALYLMQKHEKNPAH